MGDITYAIAIIAGLGSFVAPCILPMIPAFLAYISGTTITEMKQQTGSKSIVIKKSNIILNTVFFVLGFSVVFSTLGVLINSTLVGAANQFVSNFNQIGGVIIIIFGTFLLLTLKFNSLNIEKRFFPKRTKVSYPLSFLFGLAFAAGWTPCVGPILGTILTLAATTPSTAFNLLLAYSLGLGIPFILMGIFFSKAEKFIKLMMKHMKYYTLIIGILIIFLGVLVLFNQLSYIANFPILNNLLLN